MEIIIICSPTEKQCGILNCTWGQQRKKQVTLVLGRESVVSKVWKFAPFTCQRSEPTAGTVCSKCWPVDAVTVSGLICDPAGLTQSGFRQMRAGGLSGQLHVKACGNSRLLWREDEQQHAAAAAACSSTPLPYFTCITILLCAYNAVPHGN